MSYAPARVYGSVEGLPRAGYEALAEAFSEVELEYRDKDGWLTIAFEGDYFFIDDFMELLTAHLNADCVGKVDYIDQEEFTMDRYKIESGEIDHKNIDLNDTLERYSTEQ